MLREICCHFELPVKSWDKRTCNTYELLPRKQWSTSGIRPRLSCMRSRTVLHLLLVPRPLGRGTSLKMQLLFFFYQRREKVNERSWELGTLSVRPITRRSTLLLLARMQRTVLVGITGNIGCVFGASLTTQMYPVICEFCVLRGLSRRKRLYSN